MYRRKVWEGDPVTMKCHCYIVKSNLVTKYSWNIFGLYYGYYYMKKMV